MFNSKKIKIGIIMKKLLLILTLFIATYSFSNAQELGLRFGSFSGGNVAIDGIFSTGEFNRIHADLAFFEEGVIVNALWDFIYRPLGEEGFNWYAGAGPYAKFANDFDIGAKGEIGIEYLFAGAPIALGLDWRPALEIIDQTSMHFDGFGLNVRWVFGK